MSLLNKKKSRHVPAASNACVSVSGGSNACVSVSGGGNACVSRQQRLCQFVKGQ